MCLVFMVAIWWYRVCVADFLHLPDAGWYQLHILVHVYVVSMGMLIALFNGDKQTAEEYHRNLQQLMVSSPCGSFAVFFIVCTVVNYFLCWGHIPRYYMVPDFSVEDEKRCPGSQLLVPDPEEGVFVWGASLYIIACLLCKIQSIGTEICCCAIFLLHSWWLGYGGWTRPTRTTHWTNVSNSFCQATFKSKGDKVLLLAPVFLSVEDCL